VQASEINLCHTVLGGRDIQAKYSDKVVLIDGNAANDLDLAIGCGFKKIVLLEELIAFFP
jgi:hypothetical protein